jgi:hypothetical protein
MNLRDYQKKYGLGSLAKLGQQAGLPKGYIYLLAGGHRGITLKKAERLKQCAPELDVMSLMKMRKDYP